MPIGKFEGTKKEDKNTQQMIGYCYCSRWFFSIFLPSNLYRRQNITLDLIQSTPICLKDKLYHPNQRNGIAAIIIINTIISHNHKYCTQVFFCPCCFLLLLIRECSSEFLQLCKKTTRMISTSTVVHCVII